MVDEATTERIAVLASADEPSTPGQIQRRLASTSRDVTTGVIREACSTLVDEGGVEQTDEVPPGYRLLDD